MAVTGQVARSASPIESARLAAKLRAPLPGAVHIRRSRLLALLDEVSTAPFTLIVAPAGAGKTVLATTWVAERGSPTAWLTLDESDRDGGHLWASLIAALGTLAPGIGTSALAQLRRSSPLTAVAGELLHDLDSTDRPDSFLLIDDLHLADVDSSDGPFALFVQHVPAWLHVIALSRREPEMALDRLRARGQLGEIRFAELRFSSDEARQMLASLSPKLSDAEIDAITEEVGGWAAGLQLAALTARSRRAQGVLDEPVLRGGLLVEDYLLREVLAAEPAELVDALLDVAVVDPISSVLACELTGRPDADELLRQAERHNLFITRVGPHGWFRIQPLIREALVAELGRRSPERLANQHAAAARWLEGAGEVVPALEHWLLAGRPREALRLLADANAELYYAGLAATILATLDAIPPDVASADLDATFDAAWSHLFVRRRRFLELVGHLTWRAEQGDGVDPAFMTRLTMIRSIAATTSGDWDDAVALAREAIADLGDRWSGDRVGQFAWNTVARATALTEAWDDDADDVTSMRRAVDVAPERRLGFEGTRALGHALAGRPVDALRVAAGVRGAADVTFLGVLRAELALAEAVAHRELGDRERALPELHALADAPAEAMLYCRILAMAELSHTHLDAGDTDGARRELARAETIVEAEPFGAGVHLWLGRLGAALDIAVGDLDAARRRAEAIADPFWRGVSAARVALAGEDTADAAEALEGLMPRCVRHEVVLHLLRARAIDEHQESLKMAATAVDLASANGMLQTVASEGPQAMELVEMVAWRAPAPWMDRLRRAAAEGRLRSSTRSLDLIEPLTERECDVLRYLPSRLTAREIAQELFISANTLKFHLKVIYRKLGVHSRVEAAEVARHMGLERNTR